MAIRRLTVPGLGSRPVVAVLLCVVVLAGARPAAAQGTMGMLPDPLSSRDLSEYAGRLALSDLQREALEAAHDEYKRQFAALREGEIAAFLEEMRTMQGTGGMPDLEVVESFLSKWERLQGRIKALDEAFFTRLEPLLEDPQKVTLPRLRLLRERQRYHADQLMSITGRRPVDLSEIFHRLDLPDDARALVDPAFERYEHQLTRKLRELAKISGRMFRDMIKAYDELGYSDLSEEEMADPEVLKTMMEDTQRIWAELTGDATEVADEISRLNGKTLKQVALLLGPEATRTLRQRYYGRAYPELRPVLQLWEAGWLDEAAEAEGLSDEQRSRIAELAEAHRREADRFVQKAVKLMEASRGDASPFAFDLEAMEARQQELMELQSKVAQLDGRTRAALQEIAGVETPPEQDALAADAVPLRGGMDSPTVTIDGVEVPFRDQWVPPPISARDVARYAETLALEGSDVAIADGLLAYYRQQLKSATIPADLMRAVAKLWTTDRATGVWQPPTEGAIERVYELRRQVRALIAELDRSLFEDLKAVVPQEKQDAVERLHLQRQRRAYTSRYGLHMLVGGSQEYAIDLVDLLAGADLDDATRARIDTVLAAWEAASLPVLRALHEAQMGFQKTTERWSAFQQHAAQHDPAEQMAAMRRYQEIIRPATERVAEAADRLTALNRQSFAALVELLPEATRRSIRRTYKGRAHPTVYNDPLALEDRLTAALGLEDLAPEQLEDLGALANGYRQDYERLSEQMVGLSATRTSMWASPDEVDWQAYQERQEALEKLRFERNELSYRAIAKLRSTLGAEQIERIGGLPETATDGP